MAVGPEVGVAYVIIRADTKRLAGDVADGVKDVDTDKAGKSLGGSLGDSSSEAFGPPFKDGVNKNVNEGMTDAFNNPDNDKAAEESGERTAESHRRGFDKENKKNNPFKSLIKHFKGIAVTIGALAGPQIVGGLLTALGGLVAGATEILGFLVTAAAGAGVAMGGIFAAAIPAAGLLVAALKVNTKQLEAFKKALGPIGEQWKEVAEVVQENLLPGILDMLEATTDLIPIFKDVGKQVGIVGGNFFKMAGFILTSEKNVRPLNKILLESAHFLSLMSEAALIVFDALIPLFSLMTPLAVQFAGSLRLMAEHFNAFVTAGTGEGGTLGEKFQLWYDRLAQVFRIVGDLGVLFWNIFSVAADAAAPLFDSIEKTVQTWRDWSSSEAGKNWLAEWFEAARPFLHEVWELLKDIGEIVIGPLLDTDFTAETNTVKTIREDWLPVFERLGDALSKLGIGDALLQLANAFVDLIESFEGSSTVATTIGLFADAIKLLADILSSPAAVAIAPTLATIIGTITVMKFLGLTSIATGLFAFADGLFAIGLASDKMMGSSLFKLGEMLAPFSGIILGVVVAIAAFVAIWVFWDDIVAGLSVAWEWFTKLNTPLQILIGTLAALAVVLFILYAPFGAIIAAAFALVAVIKNWEAIAGIIDKVWDAIWEFVTNLPEMLAELIPKIGEFFTNLWDSIVDFVNSLPEILANIGTSLKDALLGAIEALPGLILDALGALGSLGMDIIGFIADGLAAALPALAEFFITLPFKIIGFLGSVLRDIYGIGINIIQFIIEGLVEYLPQLLFFFLKLPFEILTLLKKGVIELVKLGIEMISALIRGLIAAAPRVIAWVKNLPFMIISGIGTAVIWLVNVGRDIIDGLWQGIQTAWDMVLTFFTGLPAMIIGFFGDTLTWLWQVGSDLINGLWQGIQSFWDSVLEFFGVLPQTILDLIVAGAGLFAEIGLNIITWILEGLQSLVQTLWDWFTGLPQYVWDLVVAGASLIVSIGSAVINWILEGLASIASTLWEWFTNLPGDIWNLVKAGASSLKDIGINAVIWIIEGLASMADTLWTYFTELPGKLWDLVKEGSSKIIEIGSDIVGWIIDGLKNLPSLLWDALKTAWNWVADKFQITIPIPFADDITISAPHLEMGAIIPGSPGGTRVVVSEKNRAEAIIPITHPARALALMRQAGLDQLVLAHARGTNRDTPAVAGAAAGATMLRIDNATFQQPVDADMMAQKVFSAFRRLAS